MAQPLILAGCLAGLGRRASGPSLATWIDYVAALSGLAGPADAATRLHRRTAGAAGAPRSIGRRVSHVLSVCRLATEPPAADDHNDDHLSRIQWGPSRSVASEIGGRLPGKFKFGGRCPLTRLRALSGSLPLDK